MAKLGVLAFLAQMLLLAALLSSSPAYAQLQTGNLYGTVTDQGSALPGVTVTLAGLGAPQVQVTNAQGQFRFLGLSSGSYSLEAVLEGFDSITYPNIAISVGRNTEIEVTLNPAAVEDETLIDEPQDESG
jgi:hypothetical protein